MAKLKRGGGDEGKGERQRGREEVPFVVLMHASLVLSAREHDEKGLLLVLSTSSNPGRRACTRLQFS